MDEDQQFAAGGLFDLRGKVACVTGASAGLGRQCALTLLNAGVKVVGVARRPDLLDELVSISNGNAHGVAFDLSNREKLSELATKVCEPFGSPDIFVHAAGVNLRETASEITPKGWDLTLDLNLAAPLFLAQKFVPNMKKKGWGRIVNFASLQTFRAFPGGVAYGASKAGIAQLTRSMAEEWSSYGINANAIGPGFFKTELTAAVFNDSERAARNAEQTCIGRNGDLEDIAGPLLFLCSDASNYVTGQTLMVDGGFTAK